MRICAAVIAWIVDEVSSCEGVRVTNALFVILWDVLINVIFRCIKVTPM